jgi:hypothetical protein
MSEKRCGSCLGMGYKGRWVPAPKRPNPMHGRVVSGKIWKVGTCPSCQGTGSKQKSA